MERIAERHITHKKTQCTTVAQSWRNLVWIFAIMSVLGLLGETLQHWIAFGVVESRAGLVWGPFSPIYGLAAVLLSVFLEPFSDRPYWFLFFIAAVVGGSVEYFASWAMETFWGVVAWSYLDLPFNFDGRTDVFHCAVWGYYVESVKAYVTSCCWYCVVSCWWEYRLARYSGVCTGRFKYVLSPCFWSSGSFCCVPYNDFFKDGY